MQSMLDQNVAEQQKRHLLIIGGAGFIGSHLVSSLAAMGHRVRVLDKREPPARVQQAAECLLGDVRSYEDVSAASSGASIIYNLAAEHRDDVRPISLYDDVNVNGARIVCKAAAASGVPRIIFTSSVAVYGSHPYPMDETTPHDYFNDYGRTKHLAEKQYEEWLSEHAERQLTIVRPTVVFGPGNRGNVYNLLRQLKRGPFAMFGDGHNIKSVAHVNNVSAFLSFIGERAERYGVYNYADKPDLSMKELVHFSDKALGRRGARASFPQWTGLLAGKAADAVAHLTKRNLPISEVRVQKFCAASQIDSRKAFATGFQPSVPLEAGLREMILDYIE
jgi:nucleoside-diphosphate-sugar epimerase